MPLFGGKSPNKEVGYNVAVLIDQFSSVVRNVQGSGLVTRTIAKLEGKDPGQPLLQQVIYQGVSVVGSVRLG
jgi:hypothetical protein